MNKQMWMDLVNLACEYNGGEMSETTAYERVKGIFNDPNYSLDDRVESISELLSLIADHVRD